MTRWGSMEPEPGVYVEATISGRRTRIYHGSIIEPFGEPSSGEILVVPPGDCDLPMPTVTTRHGTFRSVPQRVLPRANR